MLNVQAAGQVANNSIRDHNLSQFIYAADTTGVATTVAWTYIIQG